MSCGPLLLVLVGVPALELMLMIEVGGEIGAFETVLLVFVTAALGLYLTRGQSMALLEKARSGQLLRDGEQLSGPLLALAALLLLFPGFITDGIGALLLIPPVRRALARYLGRKYGGPKGPGSGGAGPGGPDRPQIIVVESGPETVSDEGQP